MTADIERSRGDELFALLQKALPQRLLSRGMHALARSRQPAVRNAILNAVLRSYPQIDMREALQPDPFTYESFNAFFTRELRPGARPLATDARVLASPVDGVTIQINEPDRLLRACRSRRLNCRCGYRAIVIARIGAS